MLQFSLLGFDLLSYDVQDKYEYQRNIPHIRYESYSSEDIDEIKLSYPPLFKLGDLLTNWPPRDKSPALWKDSIAHPSKNNGVPRFNYSDLKERGVALRFREKEFPFMLYDIPQLDLASQTEFSISSLLKNFGEVPKSAERMSNDHYMYYAKHGVSDKALFGWSPPQEDVEIKFKDFLREASVAEQSLAIIPLTYLTISASEVNFFPLKVKKATTTTMMMTTGNENAVDKEGLTFFQQVRSFLHCAESGI